MWRNRTLRNIRQLKKNISERGFSSKKQKLKKDSKNSTGEKVKKDQHKYTASIFLGKTKLPLWVQASKRTALDEHIQKVC